MKHLCAYIPTNGAPSIIFALTAAFSMSALSGCVPDGQMQYNELNPSLGPPSIASISPPNGALAGNTLLTLAGTNFVLGDQVRIGSGTCTSVEVINHGKLTCRTPAMNAGIYAVTVTRNEKTTSNSMVYAYNILPVLASISPGSGTTQGGTALTLNGTDFMAGALVKIGSQDCLSPSVTSTSITCTTPAASDGSVNVSVINPDTQSSSAQNFTYHAPPTITAVSPSYGDLNGGTGITVSGTAFRTGAVVKIGTTDCTSISVASSTSLTCTTPAGTQGTYAMSVTNTDSQSGSLPNAFSYSPTPGMSSLTPNNGMVAGGNTLTISGSGFVTGATVTIGGNPCTSPTVSSSTSMNCMVPSNVAGSYSVIVTNPNPAPLQSSSLAYTYNPFPTVSSIAPAIGATTGGTYVAITGTGFISGATAQVNGAACTSPNVGSSTSLQCYTPAQTAGTYSVTVTNPDTQSASLANSYTYAVVPTISSIVPTNGKLAGGDSITVNGTDFQPTSTIKVGGVSCTSVTYISPTQVSCVVPASSAGFKQVVVTNPNTLSSTNYVPYQYNQFPTITSVLMNVGAAGASSPITVTGQYFTSGATVNIGGSSCTSVQFISSLELKCDTPSLAVGSYDVVVTNPDTQATTRTGGFTFAGPADAAASDVVASSGAVPSDGLAELQIHVVPRISGGGMLGGGATIEVSADNPSVTVAGAAACATVSGYCKKATYLGFGAYRVTATAASVLAGVGFSAVVTGTPNVTLTASPTATFDTSLFTSISANTTITNSLHAGLNLYFTGGTATFDASTEGASFGHLFVRGGTLKHLASTTTTMNRLKISASSLTLQTGSISANALGYPTGYSYGPSGPSTLIASTAISGGSHGGAGGWWSGGGSASNPGRTYGDFRNPQFPGSGGPVNPGGGVVHLTISGNCSMRSGTTISANGTGVGGAGGSVYLSCAAFAGDPGINSITATTVASTSSYCSGGGGRIALVSTQPEKSFIGAFYYPRDASSRNSILDRVNARNGTYVSNSISGYSGMGGAGTIFLKHSGIAYGDLLIKGTPGGCASCGDNYTEFVSTTENSSVISSAAASTNTAYIPPSGLPFANFLNLFAGQGIHIFSTVTSPDPKVAGHTLFTLSGNGDNSLVTTSATLPAVSNDHYYRFLYRLNHLDISGSALVHTRGADLWLDGGCDLHSSTASTFHMDGSLTVNSISSSTCSASSSSAFSYTNRYFAP